MNNARRKAIREICETLESTISLVDDLKDEEDEYESNMPESIQDGEKGDRAREVVELMDTALGHLQDAVAELQGAAE